MTLLEIKEYIEAEQRASRLRKGFVARCLCIRKYLEFVHYKVLGNWDENPYYAKEFEIDGDEVLWSGTDNDGDYVEGSFPLELLTYTDEQLEKWANDKVAQIEKQKEEELIKKEKEDSERKRNDERLEFELYQRLKEKYEGQ